MAKPPSVPDLELPGGSPSPQSSRATPRDAGTVKPSFGEDDDLFGGGIERGLEGTGAAAPSNPHHGKSVAIDFSTATDDDPFGDAIERGAGAGAFTPPSSSAMRRPNDQGKVAAAPPSSRGGPSLDIAYKPTNRAAAEDEEPISFLENLGARAVPLLGCIAVVAVALKYLHQPGRFFVGGLVPHALDASSTVQSGVLAGVFVVVSIAIGYFGLRTRPRSWATVVGGGLFLLSALAMVTVMLVSTEENPSPADGARLIPYLVPLATVLFGLGVTSRGTPQFLRGGIRRFVAFGIGLLGGVIVYAGLALSAF